MDYLSDLGDTTTASALNALNKAYLNPAGTPHTVTGTVAGGINTVGLDNSAAPGAVITGITGDVNQLEITGNVDIAKDTITGFQTLLVDNRSVTLTGDQWDEFTTIEGSGTLTLTDAGDYGVDDTAGSFNLTAQDWGGTILTGSASAAHTLTASQFGDDTLIAGSHGDTLIAGEGVDTLTGGTGADSFLALSGLADGSIINVTVANDNKICTEMLLRRAA